MNRRRLLLLAVLVPAVLPGAASAAVRSYGGTTSDGQPFVIGVNTATGNVERIGVMFSARCTSGMGYSFGHRLTRKAGPATEPQPGEYPLTVRKRARGAFTASGTAFEALSEGRIAGIKTEFTGRIRGTKVTGTVRSTVTVGKDASGGAPEDTCTYAKHTFRTQFARGRILTGQTTQNLPVVVTLTSRARSVKVMNIGWNAECEPPGFIQIPDELINFRIRGGAFGDKFDHTITLDDGTQRTFNYDLKGRATRRRASGTIGIVMEDKGGSAPGTCRTGTVRWSAS
ncbi:MAG TPA: hypothetical protein VF549_15370 [Solirubrobacteraceae bacterium]|jgi:hypothetical protein